MKRSIFIVLTVLCSFVWVVAYSQSESDAKLSDLDSCFVSLPIGDEVYSRIKGLSYRDDCTVPLDELRYIKLLHYDAYGKIAFGEMICNKKISDDIIYIFRRLFDARYPIERVRLIDEYGADDNESMINNNSSSFNFRFIAGTKRLSKHSLGMAVDINPLYNPYVKKVGGRVVVEPKEAQEYVNRDRNFKYKIDTLDLCYKLFMERGFEWGGDWSSVKDYQHFEK